MLALQFYGHGSYQEGVGKNIFIGISQASTSCCINEATNALNRAEIKERFIRFPRNINDLQQLKTRFYRKYQFPGVIGCIDCTHVAIIASNEEEHIYVNRKKYHSINTQLVCDENLKIGNVNSRYPGSSHETFIWRNFNLSTIMEQIYRTLQEPFFLLDDSGYPLRPWLQTVITNPEPGPEERMNNRLKTVRSIIERCNGLLKIRFRCSLRHRVLHYHPQTAAKIIVACSILHNMCIDANKPEPEDDIDVNIDFGMYINENVGEDNDEAVGRVNPDLLEGRQLQREIIR